VIDVDPPAITSKTLISTSKVGPTLLEALISIINYYIWEANAIEYS